jgi:hypothetical protein
MSYLVPLCHWCFRSQEIGGLLQWTAPNGDLDRVVSYDIYLSDLAAERSGYPLVNVSQKQWKFSIF